MLRRVGGARELAVRGARLRLPERRAAYASVPVLELEGELDFDTVPEIDRFLRRQLGPLYHRNHLVIDLGGVTFVDSSFIGFLVRLIGAQRAVRRELVLARPVGRVRRVLGLVGLPNVVPVVGSVEEALALLAGARRAMIPPAFDAAAG